MIEVACGILLLFGCLLLLTGWAFLLRSLLLTDNQSAADKIMDRWEREGPAWQITFPQVNHGGYDTMDGEV